MAFKDTLMTALHEAVGHFNESGDPNDAVVKTAREHDFNAEQTARLLETFNTARTIHHYKAAADRSATFELADRDDVLSALFGAREEKAAEAVMHDYSSYREPVRQYVTEAEPLEKAASQEHTTPYGLTLDAVAHEAQLALRTQRTVIKHAYSEAGVAGTKAADILTKIAADFSRGHQTDRLARLIAAYSTDQEIGGMVSKLAEFVPEHVMPDEQKLAEYRQLAFVDDRDLTAEIELLKEAGSWVAAESEMLAVAGTLGKETDAFEAAYLDAIRTPFQDIKSAADLIKVAQTAVTQKYPSANLYGEPTEVEQSSGKSPSAGGVADLIANNTFTTAAEPIRKFITTGVERAFTEPQMAANKELSERLKNVQRGIMIQDLIVNDPVLADEPPETVAEAYNSLLQLAPEVAANKEIVRAILRQTVHSVAVSPYDAEMWSKLEMNLRNIRGKGGAPAQKAPSA